MAKPSHLRTNVQAVIPTKSNEYQRKLNEAEWVKIQKQTYNEVRARQIMSEKENKKKADYSGLSPRYQRRLKMLGIIS
jgi:hypothetical protein|tara:strand:- start:1056 stop:1289 length:234 start_codon:yes stop_codon:yes gene_type:complete